MSVVLASLSEVVLRVLPQGKNAISTRLIEEACDLFMGTLRGFTKFKHSAGDNDQLPSRCQISSGFASRAERIKVCIVGIIDESHFPTLEGKFMDAHSVWAGWPAALNSGAGLIKINSKRPCTSNCSERIGYMVNTNKS